ncbi:MAG: LysE family transporter [Ichthyobacteriaceae bacterium]|nr:LysE family transporter [Ichthyobacteriaceae bacterium]
MLEVILYAIPLGLTLSVLVGPVFFVLIETSITKGARAAFALDAGVIIADIFYIAISFFSSKQLLQDLNETPSLFLIGGAVIFVYGLRNAIKKDKIVYEKVEETKTNYLALMLKGFFLNIINLGVLIFWLGAMVIAGHKLEFDPHKTSVYFATVIITYLLIDFVKISLAKEFKKKLTNEVLFKIKKVIGIILMIFGIIISLKAFISNEQIMSLL